MDSPHPKEAYKAKPKNTDASKQQITVYYLNTIKRAKIQTAVGAMMLLRLGVRNTGATRWHGV